MKKKTPQKVTIKLESTAYHEAGHAVVQNHFGIKIKKITIVPDGDSLGSVSGALAIGEHRLDVDKSDKVRLKTERDVMIFLAGRIAERKFNLKGYRHYGASQDINHSMKMLSLFTRSREEQMAYHRFLEERTKNIINEPMIWELIQSVAKELLLCETLTGKQFDEVVLKTFPDLKALLVRRKKPRETQ